MRRLGARISASFDRLPIRTRLAAVSAFLTFAILCVFAVVVGFLIVQRLRSDFTHDVEQTAAQVTRDIHVYINPLTPRQPATVGPPTLAELAGPQHAAIKLYAEASAEPFDEWPDDGPSLGSPPPVTAFFGTGFELGRTVNGYQVETLATIARNSSGEREGVIFVQYARPLSSVAAAAARVELFLVLGVLAGTGCALLAGTMIARRAMLPIAALTSTAEQIARTRDRTLTMPDVEAHDEVGELARTLDGMLRELDAAHAETEGMLERQRQFVADASHELRTPLTSVLANLDILSESLRGEQGEAARSALRSSQRMRRLVADLLLLARSDIGRALVHRPVDLAQVAVDAAAELGPMSDMHEVSVEAGPAITEGSRDELDRVAINLIENALRHTPPGTRVWVSSGVEDGMARLVVEDDGPGIPDALAATLFERFVRGAGDRGGSFGLGLAIVRAVVQTHGGTVAVERTHRDGAEQGARFIVNLPLAPQALEPLGPDAAGTQAATGSASAAPGGARGGGGDYGASPGPPTRERRA